MSGRPRGTFRFYASPPEPKDVPKEMEEIARNLNRFRPVSAGAHADIAAANELVIYEDELEALQRKPGGAPSEVHSREDSVRPSLNAEWLVSLFAPAKYRAEAVGDFIEEFPKQVARYGRRRATLWAWKQVISSAWAVVSPTAKLVAAVAAVKKLFF